MRLKEGFITQDSDGEQVMVATGDVKFAGLVRSNKTAAFIVDCLKTDTTKEQIVDALLEKYEADKTIVSTDVEKVLLQLKGIGAIDE